MPAKNLVRTAFTVVLVAATALATAAPANNGAGHGNANGNGNSNGNGNANGNGNSAGNGNGNANGNGNSAGSGGSGGSGTPTIATCSASDISITGASCLGFYSGNLNGNAPSLAAVNTALGTWHLNLTEAVDAGHMISSLTGNTINFSQQLYGDTIIGVHYGNVNGSNNVTAFYRFDAGTTGIDAFTTSFASLSNATLYRTGVATTVPEPETYAMLLAGLGLVGVVARRRRK